jgi:bifunctional DNA-binding transcriptional regulator/antitoxin component of YhaV-PrlF toxin-antitoxin module
MRTLKTAGYSGTPLHKKLGIKPGDRVWFFGAPDGYEMELQKAGNFERVTRLAKNLDFIHLFTNRRTFLDREMPKLRGSLLPGGMVWVSWPKKSSGMSSDLDENIVREIGLQAGMVDVKVCAVDETWSGLKFVFRLKDR